MPTQYKKILLPLDGSEFAAEALPHAEAIAAAEGAELILFEVVQDPLRLMVAAPGVGSASGSRTSVIGAAPTRPDSKAHAEAMDGAQRELEEIATSLKHRHINVKVDIDTGEPAACIVDYAAAHDIDLIVMHTHGRTGVRRWAYGSVTNKVLQAAHCSVLMVRG